MTHTSFFNVICLQCHNSLVNAYQQGNYLVCPHCQFLYPLLADRIPVLFENSADAIVHTYVHYQKHLTEQQKEIEYFNSLKKNQPARAALFDKICLALTTNATLIRSIQESLLPFITVDQLKASLQVDSFAYTTDLSYLCRDWSQLKPCEQQVATLLNTIEHDLGQYVSSDEPVLVVGAGMGRIAAELCKTYRNVYAIDNSITMASCYHSLLKKDINFFDIQLKGVFKAEDMVFPLKASMNFSSGDSLTDEQGSLNCQQQMLTTEIANQLQYVVGNALQMPFADHSMQAIVSVYFTDVFPIKFYLQEIKRVLMPGGIFIHLGPLEYHFNDKAEMYAADEIKEIFIQNGFSWLSESIVKSTHLYSPFSMLSLTYDNWKFTALYPAKATSELNLASVICLKYPLQYQITGMLQLVNTPANTNEEGQEIVKIYFPGSEYSTTTVVLDIFKLIDGKRNVEEMMYQFSEQYELEDNPHEANQYKTMILETIRQFVDNGVLGIC